MAAAALLLGTAIPALVHVSNAGGTDPNTAMAGQSELTQGTEGKGRTSDGATGDTRGTTGDDRARQGQRREGQARQEGRRRAGVRRCAPTPRRALPPAPPTAPRPSWVSRAARAAPTRAAWSTAASGSPTSPAPPARSPARVRSARRLSARPTRPSSSVAAHVSGDAASGLPDPSLTVSALVLQPGGAYAEKFAFVPSETCPVTGGGTTTTGGSATGGAPRPTPRPARTRARPAPRTPAARSARAPQLLTVDGPADGSVQVTYSAAAGARRLRPLVSNACAGTVYYSRDAVRGCSGSDGAAGCRRPPGRPAPSVTSPARRRARPRPRGAAAGTT